MAKEKKVTQDELKRFFENTRKNLQKLRTETGVWVKKGEAELSRISKIGKLEIDVVNLSMKREKLFKDIGKRVVEQGLADEISDPAVKDMDSQVNAILRMSKKKKSEMSRIGRKLLKAGKKK